MTVATLPTLPRKGQRTLNEDGRWITLADVAQRAGVSTSAASVALNGRKHTIPAATRERIRAVADQLGYLPLLQRRTRLEQIARAAGVSKSTASLRCAPGRIPVETRARIVAAARSDELLRRRWPAFRPPPIDTGSIQADRGVDWATAERLQRGTLTPLIGQPPASGSRSAPVPAPAPLYLAGRTGADPPESEVEHVGSEVHCAVAQIHRTT